MGQFGNGLFAKKDSLVLFRMARKDPLPIPKYLGCTISGLLGENGDNQTEKRGEREKENQLFTFPKRRLESAKTVPHTFQFIRPNLEPFQPVHFLLEPVLSILLFSFFPIEVPQRSLVRDWRWFSWERFSLEYTGEEETTCGDELRAVE